MPDSAPNTTVFTEQASGGGGSGYPPLRMLVLVCCGTRTALAAVFGPATRGETTYAAELLPTSLREGMIMLADPNFAWALLLMSSRS